MGRGRRSRLSPSGSGGDAEAEDLDETDETAEETQETGTTSLEDLVGTADPQEFDRNFLIEKRDVPAAIGEEFPIPQPWEAIPRAAITINLNYVYDDSIGEWVRQGPFDGGSVSQGGTGQIVAQQDLTVPANGFVELSTGVSDSEAAIFGWCGFKDPTQFPGNPEVWLTDDTSTASGDETILVSAQYNTTANEWEIVYRDYNIGNDIDIVASALRIA